METRELRPMPADARARVRRRLEAPALPQARRVATRTWAIAAALAAAIILAWWVSTLGDRSIEASRDLLLECGASDPRRVEDQVAGHPVAYDVGETEFLDRGAER